MLGYVITEPACYSIGPMYFSFKSHKSVVGSKPWSQCEIMTFSNCINSRFVDAKCTLIFAQPKFQWNI